MNTRISQRATAEEVRDALASAIDGLRNGTVTPAEANALRRDVAAVLATKEAQLRLVRLATHLPVGRPLREASSD